MGDCGEGYQGTLCGDCAKGFRKNSDYSCPKCMHLALQLFVFILLVLFAVLFFFFLIRYLLLIFYFINLLQSIFKYSLSLFISLIRASLLLTDVNDEKHSAHFSVYMRFLINHFQMIVLISIFQLDWPDLVFKFSCNFE